MAKPQSKTQKKIDNNIRVALTDVCEQALDDIDGFEWLTHQANYTNFPASLFITCVFDSRESQQQAILNGGEELLQKSIQSKLLKIGVKFKSIKQQVLLDSEEACREESNGDWAARLDGRGGRAISRNRPK